MPKKLTTYKAPPILDRLNQCTTIEQLGLMRDGIILALRNPDKFDPERRTVDTWVEAIWKKTAELIATAETGEQCTYVYNYTLRWEKPATTAAVLDQLCFLRCRVLPSKRQREEAAGIVYAH